MLARRTFFALALAPLLAAVPVACGGSSSVTGLLDGGGGTTGEGGPGAGGEGGPGAGDDGGGANGGDGGGGATCSAVGFACATGTECCSGSCVSNQCTSSIGACSPGGATCAVGTDCCTGSCVAGKCGTAQCTSIGGTCTSGGECCTGTCTSAKCATIVPTPTCTTAGNTCKASTDCCSGLCSNGTCNIASSYCVQPNDICYHAADCCTGVCTSPNANPVSATNPGTCSATPPASGGVNCTQVDGTLCDPTQVGCAAGCCSALCAPFGPTGVAICQQAQGCHVEGDLCRVNSDCCGGESADGGVLGAQLVLCSTSVNGGTIGVCMTPTGGNGGGNTCVPEGDVCHFAGTGYACSSTTKRADCCGPQSPKYLACQLDKLGVPRCLAYGLDDGGTCRQTGQTCAAASDCCNGNPCVPGAGGQLTCSPSACVPTSGACTSSADCCAGITCVVPVGALQGTCAAVPPPAGDGGTGGGGNDGGTGGGSDSGSGGGGGLGCASIGQSCASLPCCTGYSCLGGICQLPAK